MFRRRKKLSFIRSLRAIFFPRKGWRRIFYYLTHRLRRRPGDPHYIAMGAACGVGISFMPFLGVHLLSAYCLTRLLRGDVFAMIVGTAIGNPWTLPIMLFGSYYVGNLIIGSFSQHHDITLNAMELSFSTIMDEPLTLLLPMTVGAIVLGLISGITTYYLVFTMVRGYQTHRKKQLSDRRYALNRMLNDIKKKR